MRLQSSLSGRLALFRGRPVSVSRGQCRIKVAHLAQIWLLAFASIFVALASDVAANDEQIDAKSDAVKISENPSDSTTSAISVDKGFIVSIERLLVTDGRVDDTLDVTVQGHGIDFAGVVLKLACDSRIIEITEVLPGEVVDSCGWELFRPIQMNTMTESSGPHTLWQVTALAKMSADSTRPECLGFDRPASIARLVVTSAHVKIVPDTTAPIYFYWEDCRDNALSDASGEHMQVSRRVIDYFPIPGDSAADIFPTRFGTPKQCINPRFENAPKRAVDFHNGGVELRFRVDSPAGDTASPGSNQ